MDHVISVEENTQQTQESQMDATVSAPKKNLLPWKILCLVLAVLVTLGWVGIIVLLILKEEWQLVLVAWLMLYAAAHFCYWYCRRHSTRTFSAQIRQHLDRFRGVEVATASCEGDGPPSYDDLVKSEVPPPAYYTVVHETPKLRRMLHVNSLALPWFIKKKTLEQQTAAAAAAAAAAEASTSAGQQGESLAWKSSSSAAVVVVCDLPVTNIPMDDDDDEEPIELPSYDTMMREAAQPVLTPIHQALASMPSLPPPYTPKPVEGVAQQQQQE